MTPGADGSLVLDAEQGATADFRKAVLDGLARSPKEIPSKYFYDAAGSRLFERICELEEYYPTRTEIAILRDTAPAIAGALPAGAMLIEFGSGASIKVRLLLDALDDPAGYVPIDISREHLLDSAAALKRDYPRLQVFPVCADFTQPFKLPSRLPAGPRVGFFPGSTIGNFDPPEARRLLARFADRLGSGGRLLIGVDLKKDPAILHAAYNDAAGVTAAFNRNLLVRINRELGGTFDLDAFAHRAVYDAAAGRIEMHLVSLQKQVVPLGGQRFSFAPGEHIHSENSYKYAVDEFQALAHAAGYSPVATWMDEARLFSVHLLAVSKG